MTTVLNQGAPVRLKGAFPALGKRAKDFLLANAEMGGAGLSAFSGKVKILDFMPSVDTAVCALTVKRFEEEAAKAAGIAVIAISMDLPFAQERFRKSEGISRVSFLSAFRSPDFAKSYGLEIIDGPLAGLLARAVLVLNQDDIIRYAELVPDIGREPDYAGAVHAARYVLGR